MSQAPVKRLSEAKKEKIGVDGYYNIDKDTFVAMSDRAIAQAKKKDPSVIYDLRYGLVSTSADRIAEFVALNDLPELSQRSVNCVGPTTPSAPASSSNAEPNTEALAEQVQGLSLEEGATSSGSERITRGGRQNASANLLQTIRKKLEENTDPSKFYNISTGRFIKHSKSKDKIFNVATRLASNAEDLTLLNQVLAELGEQTQGVSASDVPVPVLTPEERAQRRVIAQPMASRRIFGTLPTITTLPSQGNINEQPLENPNQSLVIPEITVRPALIKPINQPFGVKQPLMSVGVLSRPR